MRSASMRVDDGSLMPALMTIRRRGAVSAAAPSRCSASAVIATPQAPSPGGSLSPGSACSKTSGQLAAEVGQLQKLVAVQVACHRLRHEPSVAQPDRPLEFGARLRQSHSAGAGVVGIIIAPYEPASLEPGDQPRHARLGKQDVLAELGDPQAVRRRGQRVQHPVLARQQIAPSRCRW